MKEKIAVLWSILFALLIYGFIFLPAFSTNLPPNDPASYALTAEDLLPLCEWEQTPITTRPVAEGILTYVEFHCGADPLLRRVRQLILALPRELIPGDLNYFISLREIDGVEFPVEAGSRSRSVRTQWFHRGAVVFGQENIFVLLGANGEYFEGQGDGSAHLVELAQTVSERIPDDLTPLQLEPSSSGGGVDEGFVDEICVEPPQISFEQAKQGSIGIINLTAEFYEPQQVIVEVYQTQREQLVMRWILPPDSQVDAALKDFTGEGETLHVDPYNDYFFGSGNYWVVATVDGKVILQESFDIP